MNETTTSQRIQTIANDLADNVMNTETVAETMRRASEGVARDIIALRYFGIIITPTAVNKEIRRINKLVNQGRRKHVSVKRPSPSLSRKRVQAIAAAARMNCIERQVYRGTC